MRKKNLCCTRNANAKMMRPIFSARQSFFVERVNAADKIDEVPKYVTRFY